MLELSIKVEESVSELESLLLAEITKEFSAGLKSAAVPIEKRIRDLIKVAIISTPEYNSLLGGQLQYEFGITNVNAKLATLLRMWIHSVTVTVSPFKIGRTTAKSGLTLQAINTNFDDVLLAPEASQITSKGQILPWLQWLLLEGSKVIIREYEVGIGRKPGRAGPYIMKKKVVGQWGVPPEFAGTPHNNFITRAVDSVSGYFDKIIEEEVTRKL